jgi:hypothetical protein
MRSGHSSGQKKAPGASRCFLSYLFFSSFKHLNCLVGHPDRFRSEHQALRIPPAHASVPADDSDRLHDSPFTEGFALRRPGPSLFPGNIRLFLIKTMHNSGTFKAAGNLRPAYGHAFTPQKVIAFIFSSASGNLLRAISRNFER